MRGMSEQPSKNEITYFVLQLQEQKFLGTGQLQKKTNFWVPMGYRLQVRKKIGYSLNITINR